MHNSKIFLIIKKNLLGHPRAQTDVKLPNAFGCRPREGQVSHIVFDYS